jgi:hypothetical protein
MADGHICHSWEAASGWVAIQEAPCLTADLDDILPWVLPLAIMARPSVGSKGVASAALGDQPFPAEATS